MSEEVKKDGYSADNIQVLEGLEAVRKRPAMYIGDVGVKGLHHLVYEVVDNSIDEALAGHCDTIDVWINEDNSVTVRDNGRGIPTAMHTKEKKSALEVVMTVLHAGGKFDKDTYKVSGGLHGVGVSCVNALSIHLRATVRREGKIFEQEYSIGKPLYDVKVIGESEETGTTVTFKPDGTIFDSTEYNYNTLAARMRELAFLNKGITITLTDLREADEEDKHVTTKFHSEGGLKEFAQYLDRNREPLISDVIYFEGEREGIPVEVSLTYNTSYTENIQAYVNNINTHEGGTHLSGFRRGLTNTLKKYATESGMLAKEKIEIENWDLEANAPTGTGEPNVLLINETDGEVAAGWSFSKLAEKWGRKHAGAMYVSANKYKSQPGPFATHYSFGPDVYCGQGTSAILLLEAIGAGVVYLDPGDRVNNLGEEKKRTQWRISKGRGSNFSSTLAPLYDQMKTYQI
jgi:DNA gyrase subunit B